jgi:hypothetical protein
MRYRTIAIKDRDRFPALNEAKKLTQPGLELGDTYVLHDYI